MERIETLKELLDKRDVIKVRKFVEDWHDADIAELMEDLGPEDTLLFFRMLPKGDAAEVFAYLSVTRQLDLLNIITTEQAANLVSQLYVDDALDFLEEVPANMVARILASTPKEKRDVLNRYLRYKEDSAGSAMSEEFLKVYPDMTILEAITYIRNERKKIASSSQVYVIDDKRKLVGVLSIGELLRAKDNEIIEAVMTSPVISCHTDLDQEDALFMIQKYDFMALPVTDSESRLVGIITADDFLDIAQEEASEDLSIMAAVQPNEKPYFEMSVWEQAKNRIPWLMILMISGMVNGLILGGFEDAFIVMPILVTFIPMLTDTGGNTGSQSSSLMIRGLAVGEITVKDIGKVVWNEFKIATIVGLSLGLVSFLRVVVFPPHDPMIGLLVGLSVFLIVVLSKLSGAVLPLIAEKAGADPALMAAPLITTIVDAGGLIIFFMLAKAIFKI